MTVKVHCMKVVEFGGTNWKPESTPPAKAVHGVANVDWVTVWFLVKNWNETESPFATWMLFGSKVKPPLSPTLTTWLLP